MCPELETHPVKPPTISVPQMKAKRTRAAKRAFEQAREALHVACTTKQGIPEAIERYVAARLRQPW